MRLPVPDPNRLVGGVPRKGPDFYADEWRTARPLSVVLVIPAIAEGEMIYATDGELARGGVELIHPLGVAYVAAAVRAAGHAVRVHVLNRKSDFAAFEASLRASPADVVGITCFVENLSAGLRAAQLAKAVRRSTLTVFGGPQATAIPETYLADPCTDVIALGEAEITFCALLKAVAEGGRLEDVAGLRLRSGPTATRPQITRLDSLPMPALDLYPLDEWFPKDYLLGGKRSVALVGSRGCPFECTYCATKVVWGRTFRWHGPERIVAEMNVLWRRYGFGAFVFYDDILTADRARMLALCEAIRRHRASDFVWCGNTRVDCVDSELLKAMGAAGCFFLSYGIESGSQRLLDRIKKGASVEQNKQALAWTREAGIKTGATMMIGLPTETRQETKETIRFAMETKPDFVNFSIANPLFGTEMLPDALANGHFEEGKSLSDLAGSSTAWVTNGRTRKELERWQRAAVRVVSRWTSQERITHG